MNNLDKYNQVFCETFSVNSDVLGTNFSNDTIENWDSVLQLSLVTSIEDAFDVMFEPEEIMDFKSYEKGKVILLKYDVII
ncbi:MAG: acyl carrier protein [Bacteroidia bacterium]|nr:acyl carrier protein [Bacteroidia bacterium]MCF8445935.1 acyl carrier protein [Bacteroidia bacterium]